MKKLLLLILTLSLSLSLLTACQNNTTPPVDTSEEETEGKLTTADILGFDKQNYNEEFNMLLNDRDRNVIDFYADANASDKLSKAIYDRNLACEEYLGVSINITTEPGQWDSGMADRLHNLILNGACEYDMVVMGLNTGILGGYIDIYKNIMKMDYVEPTHEWWVQDTIDHAAINDQLYFLTGDACITTYTYIGTVFANLEVSENFNLDVDFYELVKSGKWTLEQFITLFKQVGVDNNNDGKYDYGSETFGWCNFNVGIRVMWSAADVNLIERQADGTFAPVETLNDRTLKFIELMKNAYADPHQTTLHPDAKKQNVIDAFVGDRVLFVTWMLMMTENFKAANMESPFAILPMPKYDEQQKDYITTSAAGYNAIFFPVSIDNVNMSAQAAEYMGWYGQTIVVPEYYDQTLKYRQNDVEANIEMLDLIRDKLRVVPNETYGSIGQAGNNSAVISLITAVAGNISAETGFYTVPASVWAQNYPTFKSQIDNYIFQYYK